MASSNLSIVDKPWDVRRALRELGLTSEIVRRVADAAAAAKADTLSVDPSGTPGTQGYIKGVRTIRLELLPHGWRMSREGNVESTVSDSLGIQLLYQNVDQACRNQNPQPISEKGAGTRRLVSAGLQGELFPTPPSTLPARNAIGSVPTVWYLCVSTSMNRLCAEVSCPIDFEGGLFEGFLKRIWVVDEELEPTPREDRGSDDGDEPNYEVRIVKK